MMQQNQGGIALIIVIDIRKNSTFYPFHSDLATKMAEELDLSINEVLDLLAEFGIESSIRYDDYLTGFENLKKL